MTANLIDREEGTIVEPLPNIDNLNDLRQHMDEVFGYTF